jgi:hypothetical protein
MSRRASDPAFVQGGREVVASGDDRFVHEARALTSWAFVLNLVRLRSPVSALGVWLAAF